MASKVYLVSDEEFKEIVKQANSYSDCLRALGLGTKGGSSTDILKRRIKELECSIKHFGDTTKPSSNIKYTLDEILVENSNYTNITTLKNRLVKENRLEYKCSCCKNEGEWLGRKLVLQLDHINGKNNDHRIENLRFLCPNCHSITETYAGKNNEKKEKNYCIDCGIEINSKSKKCKSCSKTFPTEKMQITREELKNLIRTTPFLKIGEKFGISDNAIRKWCDKFNLPRKKSDILKYSDEEWQKI